MNVHGMDLGDALMFCKRNSPQLRYFCRKVLSIVLPLSGRWRERIEAATEIDYNPGSEEWEDRYDAIETELSNFTGDHHKQIPCPSDPNRTQRQESAAAEASVDLLQILIDLEEKQPIASFCLRKISESLFLINHSNSFWMRFLE